MFWGVRDEQLLMERGNEKGKRDIIVMVISRSGNTFLQRKLNEGLEKPEPLCSEHLNGQ